MPRAGSAAVAWGQDRTKSGPGNWTGKCLAFTRSCLGVPALYGDARIAWSHVAIGDRHGGVEPPPGVPVFWSVGTHGHVALSAGGGWCISTDILRVGWADRVRIATITQRWGARYLGWTETLNGVRVYNPLVAAIPTTVSVSAARILAAARHDPSRPAASALHPYQVRVVEKALAHEGLLDDRWIDGSWGSKTTAAWARWQKRLGDTTPTGRPGRAGLNALASKYGFVVTD